MKAYLRKDGRYECRIQFTVTGIRVRKSFYGRTTEEAVNKAMIYVFVNEKVYQLLTKKYTTFASEFVYHFGTHVSAANKKIVTEALLTGREMVLPLIMSRSPLAEKNMNPTCKPFLFHDKIAVQQFGGFCS